MGSVLGPTLFNVFVNDLVFSLKSTPFLYADDVTLLQPALGLRHYRELQQDLEDLADLKKELEDLRTKIKEAQQAAVDKTFAEALKDVDKEARFRLKQRKVLKGHISKVTSAHFCGDSKKAVSGSLDGKLIIWDVFSGNKMRVIPLRSSWVMACAYNDNGNFAAVGGMDNMCTVYDLRGAGAKVRRELTGMDGYLSSVRFLGDSQVITGSGDTRVVLWDLERGVKMTTYEAHEGDVISLSLHPDKTSFVTGSVDNTARLWDIREKECRQTFREHTADVSSVYFHASGQAFATASEDKTCGLFDIRSDQQVCRYQNPRESSAFTCCGLSLSGRLLMAGSDDQDVHVWDTLSTRRIGTLTGHENKVTALTISPDGVVVVTGSWDSSVRVWG
ncbi:guanine nucleotide-binding protein G(I)/G(S)/G(T) subunit beta-1 [Ixodes scapularis]|uniref:guanine nucleotide-binding protein G(I)/G(S)/G(T) subunit beta-1 n=1 Tax=Ixodes scapularis TaxID=6945 RepID=UPI001C38BA90|nr:guanine nucleotide-binding protein G(I)/G(S)/G(T) subunit beta-1 [Ixodes scapularis]